MSADANLLMPAPPRTRITSEDVEPFSAMLMGRMWARVEAAKNDPHDLYDACMNIWWAALGLEKIAIAVRGGLASDSSDAVHFSICTSNNIINLAGMIRHLIKIDPMTEKGWGYAKS